MQSSTTGIPSTEVLKIEDSRVRKHDSAGSARDQFAFDYSERRTVSVGISRLYGVAEKAINFLRTL
jgi:hypothetical protein